MALDTVADYVTRARVLLQDAVSPYRYPDADLVAALSIGMLEARKLRPDLFINRTVPSYAASDTTVVVMDEQYRMSLLYYICGHAQMRDEEATQDARASAFLAKFASQLKTGS